MKKGYEGIRRDGRGGSRPPGLKDEELEKLREHLEDKEYWTTQEIRGKYGMSLACNFLKVRSGEF
jgi:transposase